MNRKTRKSGKRHPLLLYKRAMARLWFPTLLLGLALLAVWVWSYFSEKPLIQTNGELIWLVGIVVVLAFSLFAFGAQFLAYAQARESYLLIVTPFLRLRISYRRILSVHPASFQQLFPSQEAGWAQRRFLEPFYGTTSVVVELSSFPMSRFFLRLFWPPQMFLKQTKGLVLVVPDWMDFSTEIDSLLGQWLQHQQKRPAPGTRWA